MGRSIFSDNAAAVDGEHHRQGFDTDIMKYLVISPLEKRGINGDDRFEPFGGHAGRKRNPMLFGNADIEKPVGIGFGKVDQSGAFGHGSGNRHDFFVGFSQLEHCPAEYLGIGRGCGFATVADTGLDFKAPDPMKMHRVFFRRRISFAFDGGDMKQDRIIQHFDVVQNIDKMIQLVAVDGPEIFKAEGFKEHSRRNE